MFLIRLLMKLLVLPVVIIITLLQWVLVFLTSFTSVVTYILAGICFIVGVLGYLMGISDGPDSVRTLVIGFAVFILPFIAMWCIGSIADLNVKLRSFLRS